MRRQETALRTAAESRAEAAEERLAEATVAREAAERRIEELEPRLRESQSR